MKFDLCETLAPIGRHLDGKTRVIWVWRRLVRDYGRSYCTVRNIAHLSEDSEMHVVRDCQRNKLPLAPVSKINGQGSGSHSYT